jgi:hypothetical protein
MTDAIHQPSTELPPVSVDNSATTWWASLDPEVRKIWFLRVTGWSVDGVISKAYAEAMAEGKDAP